MTRKYPAFLRIGLAVQPQKAMRVIADALPRLPQTNAAELRCKGQLRTVVDVGQDVIEIGRQNLALEQPREQTDRAERGQPMASELVGDFFGEDARTKRIMDDLCRLFVVTACEVSFHIGPDLREVRQK